MAEQTLFPVIDKLFPSCNFSVSVKVEKIDLSSYFTCEICDVVFCDEESLSQHLPTHVKNENTETISTSISRYKQIKSDIDTKCTTSHKKTLFCQNNTKHPVTSIRDRIMFESDTDNEETESSEDGSLSDDACSTDDQLLGGSVYDEDHRDNVEDTVSKPSEMLSINSQDASQATGNTESTAIITKHILNKSYGKLLQCNICNESFAHNSSLEIHELTHQAKTDMNTCLNKSKPLKTNESTNKPKVSKITSDTNHCEDKMKSLKIQKLTNQINVGVTRVANDCKDNSNTPSSINKFKNKRKPQTNSRKLTRDNKEYVCNICLKSFLKESNLKCHFITHSSDTPWKCDFCDKTFKTRQYKVRHQRVHTDEKSFSCDICNESFRNHSSLTHHKRHHKNNDVTDVSLQRPTCALCDKQFSGKPSIQKHILSFHMTTGYPCSVCKKEYGHPIALASHMTIHKNTFKCKCGKSFQFKSDLKRHESIHKESINYECDKCNKRFGRKDHLAKHLKNVCMIKLKAYDCPNCHRVRKRRVPLATHLKLCKSKKYVYCSKCNKGFVKVSTMKRHEKYECKKI